MPEEVSYRYSKLYPKEAKEFKKNKNDSPEVKENMPRSQFSDYFKNNKDKPKEFAEIIEEEVIENEDENPFKKAGAKMRSSSISYSNCKAEKMKLEMKTADLDAPGAQNKRNLKIPLNDQRSDFMQTVKYRPQKSLKDDISPRQAKPKNNKIISKSKSTLKKNQISKFQKSLKKENFKSSPEKNKHPKLKTNVKKMMNGSKKPVKSPKVKKISSKDYSKVLLKNPNPPEKLSPKPTKFTNEYKPKNRKLKSNSSAARIRSKAGSTLHKTKKSTGDSFRSFDNYYEPKRAEYNISKKGWYSYLKILFYFI